MKRVWITNFFFLILLLYLVGCKPAEEKIKVIDCGTDSKCFMDNFKSCTPSKLGGGAGQVTGGSAESCRFYAEANNPKFSKDGKVTSMEKLSMECSVPNTNKFDDEIFTGFTHLKIMDIGSCQGTLYDLFSSSLNQIKPVK